MSAAETLQTFQRDFAAALCADDAALSDASFARQPGFAVYRNTVRLACIDALAANYPSVVQLVGEPWFHDAAAIFVAAHMPRDGRLAHYGEGFAEFLAGFEPARQLAYLPGVAQLDRCWTEAHLAADAPVLAPAALATLAPKALAEVRLVPHPAARWATFATMPVFTIWRRHREALSLEADLPWIGESALVVRPGDAVGWHAIGIAAAAFLTASAQGVSVVAALEAADAADATAAVGDWLAALASAGAFTCIAAGPR
jgi:hypothetical protein